MMGRVSEKPPLRSGKPPLQKERLQLLGQQGNVRIERPTRDFSLFSYIMDVKANMPPADQALWQMAEDAALDENGERCAWGISVKVEPLDDSEASEEVAEKLCEDMQVIGESFANRTGVGYRTKHIIHEMVEAGNCFVEQHIDLNTETGLGQVDCIMMLPTWQMRPVHDDLGHLIGYDQCLIARDRYPVHWTIPQQIVHFKYRGKDYKPFGDSIYEPLKGRWEQFKLIELDLIVAIHTRAVPPELHKLGKQGRLDGPSEKEIKDYKQELRDNPADINRFYVVRTGEVEIEFPNTSDADSIRALLETHRDLENRFVEALGIPGHITGNPKDIAGRHLSNSLDQKYARKINSLRQDFTEHLGPAIDLEFALHGYDKNNPEKYGVKRIDWKITWPDIGESRSQKTKRVSLEWTIGMIPLETAHQQLGYQDSKALVRAMMRERENGIFPLASSPDISNNNDQGKGVGADNNDEENQTQVNSVQRLLLKELLIDDAERENQLRQIVREELGIYGTNKID
jgi:hypothetical protein